MAGTTGAMVGVRRVGPKAMRVQIRDHKLTHYCGAPMVHSMLGNAPAEMRKGIDHKVHALVAAAPPPAAMIEGMGQIGFDIVHVYGLTETYGPAAICANHEEWNRLPLGAQMRRNGRQRV